MVTSGLRGFFAQLCRMKIANILVTTSGSIEEDIMKSFGDTFEVINNAPSAPTLTDQGHTVSTTLDLSWTNTSDSDGDPTHNEFQLATDSDFSTIVKNNSTANSAQEVSLTTFYYFVEN